MNSEEEIQYNSLHEGSYELVSFLDQIIYLVFLLRDTNGFVYPKFDLIGSKQNLDENLLSFKRASGILNLMLKAKGLEYNL